MTPRSLFRIILKVFGLLFLREILNTVPLLFQNLSSFSKSFSLEAGVWPLFMSTTILVFYGYIVFQLLFKTNKILDILKLDQGFDEHEFSFEQNQKYGINISSTFVLTISLVVIGCVILIDQIPDFFRLIYLFVWEKSNSHTSSEYDFSYMIISGVKIIIGFLIIGERGRIIELIQANRDGDKEEEKGTI